MISVFDAHVVLISDIDGHFDDYYRPTEIFASKAEAEDFAKEIRSRLKAHKAENQVAVRNLNDFFGDIARRAHYEAIFGHPANQE